MRRGVVWLCVFLIAGAFAAASARADDVHSVLFVFSDSRLLPTNVEIDNAFREALLAERHERVEIYTEFLDRARFGSPAYDEALLNLFRLKYSGDRTPTAIV